MSLGVRSDLVRCHDEPTVILPPPWEIQHPEQWLDWDSVDWKVEALQPP
jgi:hypothetical protein